MAGMERIHIIGCSRSGTTMLHLAMLCFANVILAPGETSPEAPFFWQRLKLAVRFGLHRGTKYYVTKRDADWYREQNVDKLIAAVRRENIGLISLVRNPRDVMRSRHAGLRSQDANLPYVSGQHWHASMLAADRVFASLPHHERKITIRYEDLIVDALSTEAHLASALDLASNPDAFPIDRVKDNFLRFKPRFGSMGIAALNGLRNMEPALAGPQKRPDELDFLKGLTPEARLYYDRFCARHGYSEHALPVAPQRPVRQSIA